MLCFLAQFLALAQVLTPSLVGVAALDVRQLEAESVFFPASGAEGREEDKVRLKLTKEGRSN